MDLVNAVLDFIVPPASLVMLAFAWPALTFIRACERVYSTFVSESLEGKVVIVTGASSAIGEQIAYEYAKRGANLVLIARREYRLRGISDNAKELGAKHVLFLAADVVKEDDCRRFITETINVFGRLDHLVNSVSLGHTFNFEEATTTSVFPHLMDINFWGNVYPTYVALPHLRQTNGQIIVNASVENWLPLPRMSLYAAAKAALVNFYETLRFEVGDEVGITIATHGWIGSDMTRGKFTLNQGAEMEWKEESEAQMTGGPMEAFARLIVSKACRREEYVKCPSWYDIFLLYRVFAPKVLNWTLRLLLIPADGTRRSFPTGMLEMSPPRKVLTGPQQYPQLELQQKRE